MYNDEMDFSADEILSEMFCNLTEEEIEEELSNID